MPPLLRAPLEQGELVFRREPLELRGSREGSDEGRAARGELRVEEILRAQGRRGVGLDPFRRTPGGLGVLLVAARQERKAEVEPGDAARRVVGRKRLEAIDRPLGPGGDRGSDCGLDGVGVLGQDLLEAGAAPCAVALVDEPLGLP